MNKSLRWKDITAAILIFLGCLLAMFSVTMVWLNQVVLDTEKYVDMVAPLSQDDAIKNATAKAVTDEAFTRAQVDQLALKALPEQADFLAAPMVGATKGFIEEQVRKQLDSPEFTSIWKEANRRAHQLVKQVLLGEKGNVYSEGGKIILDLSGLFEIVKARLSESGIDLLQNVTLEDTGFQLTIFELPNITRAQSAISLLNKLAFWLPLGTLLFFGIALWLSRSRTAAFLRIGLGMAGAMAVMLVLISVMRGYYLDTIQSLQTVDMAAATSFFDIILDSFRETIRRTFAAGLALAAVGFVLGPYPAAASLRSSIWNVFQAAEHAGAKLDLGPAGSWIHRQKGVLRIAGAAAALIVLIAIDQPSLSTALLITGVLVIYIGALEFLARKAA